MHDIRPILPKGSRETDQLTVAPGLLLEALNPYSRREPVRIWAQGPHGQDRVFEARGIYALDNVNQTVLEPAPT
jgi:hypothetical protein